MTVFSLRQWKLLELVSLAHDHDKIMAMFWLDMRYFSGNIQNIKIEFFGMPLGAGQQGFDSFKQEELLQIF